jgi:hypothetical protein
LKQNLPLVRTGRANERDVTAPFRRVDDDHGLAADASALPPLDGEVARSAGGVTGLDRTAIVT